jgi:hypothetical protein
MALTDFRSRSYGPDPQTRGMVAGWILLVAIVASFISPKSCAVTCPVVVLSFLIAARDYKGIPRLAEYFSQPVVISLTAFFAYCAVSWTWSVAPAQGIVLLVYHAVLIYAGLAVIYALRTETDGNLVRIAEGLWVGFLFGLIYLGFDLVSKGLLKSDHLKSIMRISPLEIARSITPVTLLLGPCLLAIAYGVRDPLRKVLMAAVVLAATFDVFISPHETSKAALVLSALVFVSARYSSTWTARSLAVAWFTLCMMIVPLSLSVYHLNLQKAGWVQPSAQARISIWNEHAKRILETPVFGAGYNMAYVARLEIRDVTELVAKHYSTTASKLKPYRAIHPHNVYLQVWYEMGGVGAVLFVILGFIVLRIITLLEEHQKPYILATFASGAMVLFSSYGLWQSWFGAVFVFSAIASAIAVQFTSARRLRGANGIATA